MRKKSSLFSDYGYFAMAFNTFRGCALNNDDIDAWKHNEAKVEWEGKMSSIAIRGQMSTSLEFQTALHFAASAEQPRVAQLLLELGANPQKTDAAGWTPLHAAARSGSALWLVSSTAGVRYLK